MQVIVTGGSGFIGSHVIDALRCAGHTVTNVDIRNGGQGDHYTSMDIRDVDQLARVMERHGRNAVFHLAGIANARQALDDPVTAVDMNVRGTASVLEAARQAGVHRVIQASTVWFYNAVDRLSPAGSTEPRLLDEASPVLPQGGGHVYTTSKIASELLCHDFYKLYGQEFTVLR
ncbi:MAG: NAD-dependent epimerase/dehydratase family protein, partial [Dehalococcoidia bacterium]